MRERGRLAFGDIDPGVYGGRYAAHWNGWIVQSLALPCGEQGFLGGPASTVYDESRIEPSFGAAASSSGYLGMRKAGSDRNWLERTRRTHPKNEVAQIRMARICCRLGSHDTVRGCIVCPSVKSMDEMREECWSQDRSSVEATR